MKKVPLPQDTESPKYENTDIKAVRDRIKKKNKEKERSKGDG